MMFSVCYQICKSLLPAHNLNLYKELRMDNTFYDRVVETENMFDVAFVFVQNTVYLHVECFVSLCPTMNT